LPPNKEIYVGGKTDRLFSRHEDASNQTPLREKASAGALLWVAGGGLGKQRENEKIKNG